MNIYPCLTDACDIKRIGGAELQQIMIAGGLRDRGHDVQFITGDFDQAGIEKINGFSVYKGASGKRSLPVLRFVYPGLYQFFQALRRTGADVYYSRGASYLPGIMSLYVKSRPRAYVFAGAHDTDFIPSEMKLSRTRDRLLYRYGLPRASRIIVQTEHQKKLLRHHFGKEGEVIPNFFDQGIRPIPRRRRKVILWVSELREWKRPLQFVRLARHFPDETFIMIGGASPHCPELSEQVRQTAAGLSNLRYLGFQPLDKTEEWFDACKVFVNTSVHEGFPNTFLQAWRRGIPVISYVDPDDCVRRNSLGQVVAAEAELADALKELLSSDAFKETAIMDYYQKHHSPAVIDDYCRLFESLVR